MPPKRRKESSEEIPPWGWWVIGGVILVIISTVLGIAKGPAAGFLPVSAVVLVALLRHGIRAQKNSQAKTEAELRLIAARQKNENERTRSNQTTPHVTSQSSSPTARPAGISPSYPSDKSNEFPPETTMSSLPSPMISEYYYIDVGSEQKGPYTLPQLQSMWRAGLITADMLYWQDGFNKWVPITQISKLLDPPPPATTRQPSQPSPQVIYAPAPKQQSGCNLIILIALGIVGGVLLLSFG